MKKIVVALLLMGNMLMAELTQVWVTPAFVDKKIKIIDIRTPAEWKETGIVKGSYTIMFFDEEGNFNVESFLQQLNMAVDPNKPFALLCRVGSRTGMVAEFLSDKLGYKVINLKGGIMKMIQEGYSTVPYR
ncbi:MAG: rhodanese-like domain-containing protein [Sulfurovum sp.]|nr:rhodanese-like domain-containing protein [Sulfurovum sp.]